jgi:hypothetical protein
VLPSACCTFNALELVPQSQKLETPYDTLDFFRFCVRHELWDEVYDSLSTETRKVLFEDETGNATFSRLEFSVVFPRLTYGRIDPSAPEELQDIRVVDVLRNGSILSVDEVVDRAFLGPRPRGSAWQVLLLYREPATEEGREEVMLPLHLSVMMLIDEGTEDAPRWTLGVVETIRALVRVGAIDG